MMKEYLSIRLLVVLVGTTFLASCEKEEIVEVDRSYPALFSSGTIKGVDHVINIGRAQEANTVHMINFNGEFVDDQGDLTTSGHLIVAGHSGSPTANDAFEFVSRLDDSDFPDVVASLEGQLVPVEYEYNNVDYAVDFYCPQSVNVSFNQDIHNIDKTQDLVVTWSVDPDATFDDLVISLVSRGVDGEIDETTADLVIQEVTQDDGSYTFSSSLFEEWPDQLNVDVIIGRGNQVFDDQSSTLITFINYNYTSGKIVD
ncbi:MAG: hypothetical protein EP346_07040 [Bacteroidetes bacterium]|nr:MAG: hypothetical protein EP346_07040 [Bacteroidota bacterium]